MLDLLSLNDDAILLILRHITGKDALNISLASKRAHSLANPRIASDLQCTSPNELRKLHQYLLAPGPRGVTRVLYLEKLFVHGCVFEAGWQPRGDGSYYYGSDFSQAHLLGDILSQASNITELSIYKFYSCTLKDPRIGSSLCAMTRLSHCSLFTVADGSLASLQAMHPPSLTHLTLAYVNEDGSDFEKAPKSFTPLLSTLSAFPSLHIVDLIKFTPFTGISQDPPISYPQLRSVRHLFLAHCSAVALDMVHLCPNLSTVVCIMRFGDRPLPMADGRRRWQPLQRVRLTDQGACITDHIGRVEQLQLSSSLDLFDISHSQYVDETLDLVSKASPVGLYLSVEIDTQDAGSQEFWASLAKQAPRLRSLEIKIEASMAASIAAGQPPRDEGWVAKLAEALSPLSQLLCLCVILPVMVHDLGVNTCDEQGQLLSQKNLPERLANSLPSLRYIAVGDSREHDRANFFGRDELRGRSDLRKNRWWSIKHLGDLRELEEISEEVGEEAQHLIETSGHKEGSSLEEALVRLSR